VITIDNGILHLAAATGTPTVGLFRHGIHRLWAPPFANLTVLTPGEKKAVAEIPVQVVQEAIFHAL
jgi:ADP-heptose:LPS heptosyltransferase